MIRQPPRSTLTDTPSPDTTLFRSWQMTRCERICRRVGSFRRPRCGTPRSGTLSRQAGTGRNPARNERRCNDLEAVDREGLRLTSKALPYRLWPRSEEQTSELQSLMRISYAVFCWKQKKQHTEK